MEDVRISAGLNVLIISEREGSARLWVNDAERGCLLRVQGITGPISIDDERLSEARREAEILHHDPVCEECSAKTGCEEQLAPLDLAFVKEGVGGVDGR